MDKAIHYKKRVYYAQNREDLILSAFFPDIEEGFYVDIGAYDPDFESVTKLFYAKGWRGINVEPQMDNYKKFTTKRHKDINVNVGISSKPGKLQLRSYANGGLSTFSEEMKDEYRRNGSPATNEYEDIEVETVTLRALFKEHAPSKIHFMKVDVEGLEYEVLSSNDWGKYRPEVLCIEANHVSKDWGVLLQASNYEKVFFDGLNSYYTDKNTDRSEHFDYVQSIVLEKGGGINVVDLNVILELRSEQKELIKYANHLLGEIKKRDEKISKNEEMIERVAASSRKAAKVIENEREKHSE